MQQHVRPVKHLADVNIQSRAIDPVHEQDREPVTADKYPSGRISERRQVRDRSAPQMFLNGPVSLISIAEITAKTAYRKIVAAMHRLEFVDVGELSRGHERHSQTIDSGQCGAQQRMREAD